MLLLCLWTFALILGASADKCFNYDEKTDQYVDDSNRNSSYELKVNVMDIHADLPLIVGLQLYMAADGYNGLLGNRNTLKRKAEAVKCSSSCNETLTSFFKYEDLVVSYGNVTATFLHFITMEANFTIRINANSFRFVLTKTCNDCVINWLEVQDFQDFDIHIDSSGGFISNWFLKPMMRFGLFNYNKAYISNIINDQIEILFKPFIDTYCAFEKPS